MREITISLITRLEGHGEISIFLDEKGAVEKTGMFMMPALENAFTLAQPPNICLLRLKLRRNNR